MTDETGQVRARVAARYGRLARAAAAARASLP